MASRAKATAWSCSADTGGLRLSYRSAAAGAARTHLRRDHKRLRRDARLRRADSRARSLGDRRVHARAAAEPEHAAAPAELSPRAAQGDSCDERLAERPPANETGSRARRACSRSCSSRAASALRCARSGSLMNPAQFVRSFLPAYMWMLSVTLGSLGARDGAPGVGRRMGSRHSPHPRRGDAGRCRC